MQTLPRVIPQTPPTTNHPMPSSSTPGLSPAFLPHQLLPSPLRHRGSAASSLPHASTLSPCSAFGGGEGGKQARCNTSPHSVSPSTHITPHPPGPSRLPGTPQRASDSPTARGASFPANPPSCPRPALPPEGLKTSLPRHLSPLPILCPALSPNPPPPDLSRRALPRLPKLRPEPAEPTPSRRRSPSPVRRAGGGHDPVVGLLQRRPIPAQVERHGGATPPSRLLCAPPRCGAGSPGGFRLRPAWRGCCCGGGCAAVRRGRPRRRGPAAPARGAPPPGRTLVQPPRPGHESARGCPVPKLGVNSPKAAGGKGGAPVALACR